MSRGSSQETMRDQGSTGEISLCLLCTWLEELRLDPKGVALTFVNNNVKRLLWVPENRIKPTGSILHLQLFSSLTLAARKKEVLERQTQNDLITGANNLWTLPENMVKVILKNGFLYHFE